MKYIVLVLFFCIELFSAVVHSKIKSVDEDGKSATMEINKIDEGMSGFVIHKLSDKHSEIIATAFVSGFDATTQTAMLRLSKFEDIRSDALPDGEFDVKAGDEVVLAFGYTRALLIAPSEELYYRISKSVNIEWVHPDLFATILSLNGHPTPLKSDFVDMSKELSVGLVFLYLKQKIYTLDALSFHILSIADAPLEQKEVELPFYSRVEEIEANWFGEGSSEMKSYEPHYFELLVENNRKNKKLYEIVKGLNEPDLLDEFEIGESK